MLQYDVSTEAPINSRKYIHNNVILTHQREEKILLKLNTNAKEAAHGHSHVTSYPNFTWLDNINM